MFVPSGEDPAAAGFSQCVQAGEPTREKERIAVRLSGFNARENDAWKEMTRRFGSSIKHPELLTMAEALAKQAKLMLDRDAKRRKTVLIKWFEENWEAIRPHLDQVAFEDRHQ
jgi:hypothetical protein